jgi:hypothetical protein
MNYVLDPWGNPVPEPDPIAFGRWFENINARRVAYTTLPGDIEVSTVFLGMDHDFGLSGQPVLWETMICRAGVWCEQWRYTSREAAVANSRVAEVVEWRLLPFCDCLAPVVTLSGQLPLDLNPDPVEE